MSQKIKSSRSVSVKKAYAKPVVTKGQKLAQITAQVISGRTF